MESLKSSVDLNKISLTVKALAAAILPIIHLLFGVTIVSERVDEVIDALFILTTAIIALVGYIRSKNVLGARIEALASRR